MKPLMRHIRRHRWFYAALACGILAWFAAAGHSFNARLAVAGDTFYFLYVNFIFVIVARVPAERFRDFIDDEDEGVGIVLLVTLAAVVFSIVSIFSLLNEGHRARGLFLALSLASAPLGWLALHTMLALHYAHRYYLARAGGGPPSAGGLSFPATDDPCQWDFLYYSFVVGMTAQVSDAQVLSMPMRRLTLVHGIVSFTFNTVLIALAVNTIVALVQPS